VSEVDVEELKNAVDNANRELKNRYDFRGVKASYSFEKGVAKLESEHDSQLRTLLDILRLQVIKRGIDASSMDTEKANHSGKSWSQTVTFKEGIDQPMAKKIVKLIKDKKMKVQTAIQGEELRVTGKKRDDLQAVMTLIRGAELGQPFQFNNFRD
ncbi:MAG: YajQ family cyclic di-GMP-binding protein, partial [Alteromonadales bacterium]|nr:YajQ family cyclic di-GMP-binding protein [Alteromonadales bacterium]